MILGFLFYWCFAYRSVLCNCSLTLFAQHEILKRLPGVCEYPSGSRYEGLWLDGLRHGEGVLSCPPGGGATLAGLWHRDDFNLVSAAGAFRVSTEDSLLPNVLN